MPRSRFTPEQLAKMRAARRTLKELLDTVDDRLPDQHRESIHESWFAGEWELALDLLASELVVKRVPLSPAEHEQVAAVLAEFGTCQGRQPYLEDHVGVLAALTVIDEHGRRLGPQPDHDPSTWSPRRLARAKYGRTGGHLATGHVEQAEVPHRTVFPPTWDGEKVDTLVLDVARNPDEVPEGTRNGGWLARGAREDVLIEARLRPEGPILAGYPLSGPGVDRVGALSEIPVAATRPPPFPLPAHVPTIAERLAGWRAELDALQADCAALVDALAPRLPEVDARRVRTGLRVGEFLHLADDLIAALIQERISITADEHARLVAMLDRLGLGDEDSPFLRDRDTTLYAITVNETDDREST